MRYRINPHDLRDCPVESSLLLIFRRELIDNQNMPDAQLSESVEPDDQSSAEAVSETDDRRAAARIRQDTLLKCNLGEVLNFSKSGMRLRRKRIPTRSNVHVKITDGETSVKVHADIVWVRKIGYRKYDLGLQFIDLSEEEKSIITKLAMYNRCQRTM